MAAGAVSAVSTVAAAVSEAEVPTAATVSTVLATSLVLVAQLIVLSPSMRKILGSNPAGTASAVKWEAERRDAAPSRPTQSICHC